MSLRPTILIAAMGWGGQAPLLADLCGELDRRGWCGLVWPIGGGDGGRAALAEAGVDILAPLHDFQMSRHLDDLAAGGPALFWDDPLLDYYRAFEARRDGAKGLGPEGRLCLARWARQVLAAARESLGLLRPRALLVQSGVRLVEGALAQAAREAGIPLLYCEKGVFPGTLTVDEAGIGPRSRLARWRGGDLLGLPPLMEAESAALERFKVWFRGQGDSAWEQPQREAPAALRRRIGAPADARIAFLPCQVGQDANTLLYSPTFPCNAAFLDTLLALSRGSGDLFWLVKPHPKQGEDESRMRGMLAGRGCWLPQVHVHDALEACDLVACLNSTVGLEALLWDRPVLAGAPAFWSDKGLSCDIRRLERERAQLRRFLAAPRQPAPEGLRRFLWAFLHGAVYGPTRGASLWPGLDALAERLMDLGGSLAAALGSPPSSPGPGSEQDLTAAIGELEARYQSVSTGVGAGKHRQELAKRLESYFA